jgi:HAD superfamily hydrolase (TIGR01509 family)
MNRHARRAIFFSLDGTLADNHDVMRQALGNFAAAFGHAATPDELRVLEGPPAPILIARLKLAWALPQKLDDLLRFYGALIDNALLVAPPMPEAAATLQAAFDHGWKVGIVTSNATARSRAWLARSELARFVTVVIGGDDVCLGKPEPEPYLMALARSGCTREGTIAVEDSLPGAKSATAAGLRTFGLAPERREAVDWPESVRLIAALDELVPELTRQRLRRAAGLR